MAETLRELVEEAAESIRMNRGMGIGDDSIENSLHQYFGERLVDAVYARVPEAEINEEELSRISDRLIARLHANSDCPVCRGVGRIRTVKS